MYRFLILTVYIFFITYFVSEAKFPEKDINIVLTPMIATNETLIQQFKCNDNSNIKQLNYYKQFPTKISCNDWIYKKMNTSFNMTTSDGQQQQLILNNINTMTAHVKGQLIFTQDGIIDQGMCAGARFEKLVFNKVDPNACINGKGVTTQTTIFGSIRISNHSVCEAFCFGKVFVEFTPGVGNE